MSCSTCLLIDYISIIYICFFNDCTSFVYTIMYKLLWLIVVHKHSSRVLFLFVTYVNVSYVSLVSSLGDTEDHFYWIFATTRTHSPVYCLSHNSRSSSSTTSTTSRPLSHPLHPPTSLTTDFIMLVCPLVDPLLLASNLLLALCLHF